MHGCILIMKYLTKVKTINNNANNTIKITLLKMSKTIFPTFKTIMKIKMGIKKRKAIELYFKNN